MRVRFSPRVAASLRAVAGAAYDRKGKRWRLPFSSLGRLVSLSGFAPGEATYDFDLSDAASELDVAAAGREAARERVARDPWAVDPADLAAAEPDVTFLLGTSPPAVTAVVRPGSAAWELVRSAGGVHSYSSRDAALFFPTRRLPSFLKRLRDERLTFGIERALGDRLRLSARRRASLLEGEAGAGPDLEAALLVPYLDFRGETFALVGATAFQLAALLPSEEGFPARRRTAARLDVSETLKLLYGSLLGPHEVYVTAAAAAALAGLRTAPPLPDGFAEESLALGVDVPVFAAPAGDTGSRGVVLLVPGERPDPPPGIGPVRSLTRLPSPLGPVWRFPVPDADLPAAFAAARPPASDLALGHVRGLAKRAELLEERTRFQEAADARPGLGDGRLESMLFPHQRVAVEWLLRRHETLIGDDMGLGKTLSVLAAFSELRARGEATLLVVAAPNSLVRNWLAEAGRWTPYLTAAAVPKGRAARRDALESFQRAPPDLVVANYETLRLDDTTAAVVRLAAARKTLLCLDESQRVKNPWSKTFASVDRIAGAAARRVLLSGTPAPRDLGDVWAQMKVLDRGERFGNDYVAWLSGVAEVGTEFSPTAVRRYRPAECREAVARVHEVFLRRRKEDVVALPPKSFVTRDVALAGDQASRYEKLRSELLLKVSSVSGKAFVREVGSILEQYLRAVQLGSNPRLLDPDWKGVPAKFKELDAIVDEVVHESGGKVVVWTNYLGNVRELTERYSSHGARPFSGEVSPAARARTVDDFQNDPAVKILVAVPAAGGVGITLTAAQTAVYVDKTWNAEHWLQSVDRIHRIGQRGSVTVVSLRATPVDLLIERSLAKKEQVQRSLTDGETESYLPTKEELIAAVSSPAAGDEG